ncbi:MAG: ABC transporter permease, partial [Acidobacteriota bacterium]
MDSMMQDLRFAARTLRKHFSVTLLATGSLALAIAGNTAVYSLVNSFLFRPIPYQDVERLVMIGEQNNALLAGQLSTTSPANYLDFEERQSSFQQMAAFAGSAYSYDTGGDRPEQVAAGQVTPGFFQMVGAQLAWGRGFLPEEGVAGRDRVVLLSHAFWSERFGGSSDLDEQTLKLNGELYDVVGVVGEEFEWILAPNTDIWMPLVLERGAAPRQQRSLFALARLQDGVSDEAAQAEMSGLMAQLIDEYPDSNRGYSVELLNLRYDIPDARNRLFFRLIQVALLFVLLIACANIANLLLARSQARERELAIRNSMGATRSRIIFQLFTESALMAAIAGTLGLALGFLGMKLIGNAFGALLPRFWMPTLEPRVLGYSLLVTMLGGLLFGLAPVMQSARFDLQSALKDGSQSATSGGRRRLVANVLVAAEISFALAFLAGASIMISTFQTMQSSDPGFETDNLLTMRLDLPDSRYGTDEEKAEGALQVMERLGSLPGVSSVLISNTAPRTPLVPKDSFEIADQPVADDQTPPQTGWLSASPGYFAALGIPLEQGRAFTASDNLEAARVVVINKAMAERHWSGKNPIGDRLTFMGEEREIIGVAATVGHDVIMSTDVTSLLYLPWLQQPAGAFGVALKTGVDPETVSEPVRRELLAM